MTTDADGAIRPGLCSTWKASDGDRTWTLRCDHAAAIAAQLRALGTTPARWLVSLVRSVEARDGTLTVRTAEPWKRFPEVLTAPATAPPGVAGPFRVVSGSPSRIVARRGRTTLVFERMAQRAAAAAFRAGTVDEAPVPQGDTRAALADPALAPSVRVRRLLAVDTVLLDLRHGPLAGDEALRRHWYETQDRVTYALLAGDGFGGPAYGFVPPARAATGLGDPLPGGTPPARADARVPVGLPPLPWLAGLGRIALAQWQAAGLSPVAAAGAAATRFERLFAAWPGADGVLAALLLPRTDTTSRSRLVAALGDPSLLATAERATEAESPAVPLAWAADARLVSPRLRGWAEDALGNVDYAAIR